MNQPLAKKRSWPLTLTRIAGITSLVAIVLFAVAGPGYRVGALPLMPAMLATAFGFLLFLLAFLLGATGLIAGSRRSPKASAPWVALIVIAAAAVALALFWGSRVSGVPGIHEVTTDLQDPPAFQDVIPLRIASGALNPPEYISKMAMGGVEIDVSAAQRSAYPDLQTLTLKQAPAEAMKLAEQVVQDMGWELVAAVAAEGRIEATDTTFYFGFKDDVVIRIRPSGAGSQVDLRSKSRVGGGDAGTNARRVRAFVAKLKGLSAG